MTKNKQTKKSKEQKHVPKKLEVYQIQFTHAFWALPAKDFSVVLLFFMCECVNTSEVNYQCLPYRHL